MGCRHGSVGGGAQAVVRGVLDDRRHRRKLRQRDVHLAMQRIATARGPGGGSWRQAPRSDDGTERGGAVREQELRLAAQELAHRYKFWNVTVHVSMEQRLGTAAWPVPPTHMHAHGWCAASMDRASAWISAGRFGTRDHSGHTALH